MSYYVYEAGHCQFCGKPLGTIETEGGRHREYCNSRCRQAAYRQRQKRNNKLLRKGQPKEAIERDLAQTLHLMSCDCGRGIWTVYGNVQIGNLLCGLCGTEFKKRKESQ